MSEKTAVEFTQAGKRITFSAGYIVAVSPFRFRGVDWQGKYVNLNCAVATQLGVTFVDQDYEETLNRWHDAMAHVDVVEFAMDCVSQPKGNNAEF